MSLNTYLPEGGIIASAENKEYISSSEGLEKAMKSGKILEGVVNLCDSDTYSLHIDLNGIDGVIPRDECVLGEATKDIAIITRVGKAVSFVVKDLICEDGKWSAVLSRREAQRECYEKYVFNLNCGDIIPARVTHIEPFGVFVDIGCGVIALMTVDCISVSRITDPQERFSVRDEIFVIVKSIDRESGRVYVSVKELYGTWEENAAVFSPGQTVSGIVRSVEDYGIFVELSPNLAGLAEFREGVSKGQSCAVYIKSIIPEKMKIKLVIIDTYDSSPVKKQPERFVNVNETRHIDYWRYSPKRCSKIVETVF